MADDSVVRALQYVNFHAFGGLALILAPFFLGTAMVIRRGLFWGWLAWLELALAIVAIVGAWAPIENDPEGPISLLGFIAFIGLGVTILALGFQMLTAKESSA